MPSILAADFVGLVHRITSTDRPSPFDLVELARAIAARFAASNPSATMQAASDFGMTAREFQARYAYAKALASQPLPAPGAAAGAVHGSLCRDRREGGEKRRAHFSEIPSGISRASPEGTSAGGQAEKSWDEAGRSNRHRAGGRTSRPQTTSNKDHTP